jgi:hypothetical protein
MAELAWDTCGLGGTLLLDVLTDAVKGGVALLI